MSVLNMPSIVFYKITGLPKKIFGTRNDRLLKTYTRQIAPINQMESDIQNNYDQKFSDRIAQENINDIPDDEQASLEQRIRFEISEDLREKTQSLRERQQPHLEPFEQWWYSLPATKRVQEYYRDEYRKRLATIIEAMDQDGIVPEAFAILREASRRAQKHRHFDCQLVGGRVLYEGKIAEMRTGEGKTIVCHLAAYLNILCGRKVHIITVNDYLVRRDAEFALPIFELLGITVGFIQGMVDPGGREGIRHKAYACDITYGTNSEFGFDFLRDNMKTNLEDQVQGALDFVIVDEVDSILIDEARTPLIISGSAHDDVTRYPRANKVAEELVRRQKTWDRKLISTVGKFDGDSQNIPKLDDAMRILGYQQHKKTSTSTPISSDDSSDASDEGTPALGPDFLIDDHVEAIQIYENNVLQIPPAEQYRRFFIVQLERKQVGITHEGVTIAQDFLDIGSLYSGNNMEWPHLIENALRAHKVYSRDRDYVVQGGKIVIVDPFTGRLMEGRQWSDGLHQAVEAKEQVSVKEETQTLATITIQNFIKLYKIKAGMTGTALTEATEFDKIYRLEVIEIPTNRPINRLDHNDKMYRNVDQKYAAIVDEIHEIHRRGRPADPFLLADVLTELRPILEKQGKDVTKLNEAMKLFDEGKDDEKVITQHLLEAYDELIGDLSHGRPILVGTTSVENSEKISRMLEQRYGIEHEVLNAKNHAREAEIITKAGFCTVPTQGRDKTPLGNVTIATNMAGRGTDIKLGPGVVYEKCKIPQHLPEGISHSNLYPIGITKCCIHCEEYDPATNCAHCYKPKIDSRFPDMGRKVCPINVPCGLHIIGTERHEARRIDNQLRGRAGRQGDPGSSRFSLSLEDDLLKMFMPDWMLKMMEKLGFTDGTSLEDKRLSKGIERAQRKVEERNFSTRKHLLEWDEPMDYQRKEFYSARQRILEERDIPELIFQTIDNAIDSTLYQYLSGEYNRTCITEWCRSKLDININEDNIDVDDLESAQQSIKQHAIEESHDMIRTSIGEYIDPEEPPNKWDVGGLLIWAQKQFKISMTQNQLRKMDPAEIEDTLLEASQKYYQHLELDAIEVYLDQHFPHQALTEWAKSKFNIDIALDDVIENTHSDTSELLNHRIRDAYLQREISYPVEACLERAFSVEGSDNAAAAEFVCSWVNGKFDEGWTLENIQGRNVQELHDELIQLSTLFFNGKLEQQIDENISNKSDEEAIEWAKERFGRAWNQKRFDQHDGELRSALIDQGREMLRWELTRLEQFVLLRIYDQAWKDHLLEMDHLKDAIMQRPLGGDQTHPQSQYAIEGRDLFTQMWTRIADRVTELIFKVSFTRGSGDMERSDEEGRAPAMAFNHADSTGAGFTGATRDQRDAMRAQNVDQKVETIRRDKPKIKRNEPCPCGSGKKYKQCHGKGK